MSEPASTLPEDKPEAPAPVVVKKYANRRLYNTESSCYITLDNLADMIRLGRDFVVYDAKTGEDITRGVLTQIIVEEEGKGRAMLPTGFLRQLIGFYGGNMQALVPGYLDQAMTAFAHQQQQVRDAMQKTVAHLFPFASIEEVSRQNIAMMERAMSLWQPFYRPPQEIEADRSEPAELSAPVPDTARLEIEALRAEVETLRRRLSEANAARPAPASSPGPAGPAVAAAPAAAAGVKPQVKPSSRSPGKPVERNGSRH